MLDALPKARVQLARAQAKVLAAQVRQYRRDPVPPDSYLAALRQRQGALSSLAALHAAQGGARLCASSKRPSATSCICE